MKNIVWQYRQSDKYLLQIGKIQFSIWKNIMSDCYRRCKRCPFSLPRPSPWGHKSTPIIYQLILLKIKPKAKVSPTFLLNWAFIVNIITMIIDTTLTLNPKLLKIWISFKIWIQFKIWKQVLKTSRPVINVIAGGKYFLQISKQFRIFSNSHKIGYCRCWLKVYLYKYIENKIIFWVLWMGMIGKNRFLVWNLGFVILPPRSWLWLWSDLLTIVG